eukprot:4872065-Pyramimonas_sp.AAC.2
MSRGNPLHGRLPLDGVRVLEVMHFAQHAAAHKQLLLRVIRVDRGGDGGGGGAEGGRAGGLEGLRRRNQRAHLWPHRADDERSPIGREEREYS